eukprot:m.340769 g.340769  ORF g.340769 m.340769 type:complete len:398 (-) comp19515_c0_seq1:118-1311(-)
MAISVMASKKEANPFSFSNFNKTTTTDVPFPEETNTKKEKKKNGKRSAKKPKKTSTEKLGTAASNPPPGSRIDKDEEENPFAFKNFEKSSSSKPASQPSSKPATPPSKNASPTVPIVKESVPVDPLRRSSSTSVPLVKTSPFLSSSSSDDDDDEVGVLGFTKSTGNNNARAPVKTQHPSVALGGSSSSSDSDSDNEKPVTISKPKATEAKPGKPASIVERIKKRMALLEEQLTSSKRQIAMEREQHEMDIIELKEQNELLIAQAHKAKSSAKKAEKKAAAAESAYQKLKESEQQEAAVLEDFTERVGQNLERATARANKAEQQVASLSEEVNRLRAQLQNQSLSGSALEQANNASRQLNKLSVDSEKALRDLFKGIGTLQTVSQILASLGKVSPVDE